MSVVSDQWVAFYVHFLLNVLNTLRHDGRIHQSSHSEVLLSYELILAGPDTREGSAELIRINDQNSQVIDIDFVGSTSRKGKGYLI